jgi:hypothetical protein
MSYCFAGVLCHMMLECGSIITDLRKDESKRRIFKMKGFFVRLLPAIVLSMAMTGVMLAGPISGAMSLSGFGVTESGGADLLASTSFTDGSNVVSALATGDYSIVPEYANYNGFTLDLATIATGGGFTIDSATYGNFVATYGEVVNQNASFLDVYLRGTYTPGSAFDSSITPDDTSFRLGLNQSGTAITGGGTLNSPAIAPPSGVPEPASMLMLGSALVALAVFGRRKLSR